jgi:hypothetical protein
MVIMSSNSNEEDEEEYNDYLQELERHKLLEQEKKRAEERGNKK